MTRILVIDNYDSFVYNLVHYLQQLGTETTVVRNDAVTLDEVAANRPDGILLSPGPGAPADAGICEDAIRWAASTETPMLGVCLGHQALAEVYGGVVDRAPQLMHGRTSRIDHDNAGVFAGLPQPLTATRYHSLAVVDGTVGPELTVTARADDGVIMGLRHTRHPLEGVQFHPESVLSEGGHRMLASWLTRCGHDAAPNLVPGLERDAEQVRLAAQ